IRMMLELALTELWMAKGDKSRARDHGTRLLESARATEEHTWQALAWEMNARVAVATSDDLGRALDCLAQAFAAMEAFEPPLAAWRVHATGADLMQLADRPEEARRHQDRCRSTALTLADSLPADHPLRATFMASVSRQLNSPLIAVAEPTPDPGR